MKRVFLLGNGESRKNFDISILKKYGRVYGCNAIYRDHPNDIDVLTAVDNGISHEIYHSGIALKKECYFRNWTKLPAMMFDQTLKGVATDEELQELKEFDFVKQNERGNAQEFVIHGSNMKGMVKVLRTIKRDYKHATKEIVQEKINHSSIYVSWIQPDDKSHCVKDVMPNYKDHGWACGATSGFIACKKEDPDEIYLIGHDLVSDTGKVNNLYKGTKNYVSVDNGATPHNNWVNQWFTLMDWERKRKFFKVNKAIDNNPTNQKINEWSIWEKDTNLRTLTYITQAQLLDKLQKE